MPIAAYQKFDQFIEDTENKIHNMDADQIALALTNVQPVAANSVLADITQIDYTNLSPRNLTRNQAGQTNGLYTITFDNIVLTSSGGATGPFQWIVVYNDDAADDNLICFFDYGSPVTLNDTESLPINWTGPQLYSKGP